MQRKVVRLVLFFPTFLTFLLHIGCSNALPLYQSEMVNLQKEIQEYGIIQQPDLYLYLKSRLSLFEQKNQSAKIIVLSDSHPRAFSTPREIVITSGLISNSTHPSQLDFIIAHELGHIVLKHNQSNLPRLQLEVDADEFAATRLAQNRILCKEVLHLFSSNNQYPVDGSSYSSSSYPSYKDRMTAISNYITPCSISESEKKQFQKVREILIDSLL